MNSSLIKINPDQILNFWYAAENRPVWFNSTPEMDAEITEKFSSVYNAAIDHSLDVWKQTANGCLALVIVLDQFPLNMFRRQAKSFQSEKQAIETCYHAIDLGFDQLLEVNKLAFLYMPLMHSERIADQNKSVELFTTAGLENNARFAEHHRNIIQRFGRFPHRNIMLGRTSTAAEIAYLESDEAFKG